MAMVSCLLFYSVEVAFCGPGHLFSICSNFPQKNATIIWHNKGALRENGTDLPHNLRKALPAMPMQADLSCRCGRSSGAQQAHKKLSPVSMRGNSQNGGQTTKSLLIKPQCSGVPIQQAVSLSSSFPRHCLLFVLSFCGQTASSFAKKLPYSLCTAAFCYTFCFFTWRFARWFTIPDAAAPSASPSTMPPRISVGKCT